MAGLAGTVWAVENKYTFGASVAATSTRRGFSARIFYTVLGLHHRIYESILLLLGPRRIGRLPLSVRRPRRWRLLRLGGDIMLCMR